MAYNVGSTICIAVLPAEGVRFIALIQNISYAKEIKMNPLVTKTQYHFTGLHNEYS